MNLRPLTFLWFLVVATALTGCHIESYPSDRLAESLQDICRKEYGIDRIDVAVKGKTIGVFLPLEKLFASDFKESVIAGKVRSLETLFEPSPEAMEKVEDVLFSMSRVLLSTNRKLDFYVLQATDVERTGLQLVLKGHVDDVRRVRIWDISRDEYRKRVMHEMKQNHAVLWHAPIRSLFKDLESGTLAEISVKYFDNSIPYSALQDYFFNLIRTAPDEPGEREWRIRDMRSIRVQRGEVLIYVRVEPYLDGQPVLSEDIKVEYLFMAAFRTDKPTLERIIPFQYLDEWGKMQKIDLPADIRMDQSLETWEREFDFEEMHLGAFLAEQLTRRIQLLAGSDERIQNTFRQVKMKLNYEEGENPEAAGFVLELEDISLRDFNNYTKESLVYHEDMIYLLQIVSREILTVLRSYQFKDYGWLTLRLLQEPSAWILGREDLELLRRNKGDLPSLLTPTGF